jgi:hypothetical protein
LFKICDGFNCHKSIFCSFWNYRTLNLTYYIPISPSVRLWIDSIHYIFLQLEDYPSIYIYLHRFDSTNRTCHLTTIVSIHRVYFKPTPLISLLGDERSSKSNLDITFLLISLRYWVYGESLITYTLVILHFFKQYWTSNNLPSSVTPFNSLCFF